MRRFFVFLVLCAACMGKIQADYSFTIQPRSYLFSTYYDVDQEGAEQPTIENHSLQLRRIYSVCDEYGEVARGVARLLSFGALFTSLKEIDCYDQLNRHIGLIQGHWWTTAAAKFTFTQPSGHHYATAYVDLSGASVNIVDAFNERVPLATMHRHYIPGGGDYSWDVKVLNEELIDFRIIQMFAAFIIDAFWPSSTPPTSTTHDIVNTAYMINTLMQDDR